MKIKTPLVVALAGLLMFSKAMALQVTMQTYAAGANGNYRADPSADLEWVLNNYNNGLSKFTDAKGNTWFGTFCLEADEYFTPGATYDVVINTQANNGGTNTNSGDPLSVGTAFLYENFVRGTLSGLTSFTYNNANSSLDLQKAIWWLENESTGSLTAAFSTLLTNTFGSTSAARANYTGSSVRVMNLTSDGGRTLNQDQLVFVPDGGWTAVLLGLGLVLLALIKGRNTFR
ncbi:MAG TPA: VPDSG-CTERM sorting domain-containing protein [Candidatus Didemnitutus sp.]|nr:VPDSG-CTERM sorting domain-containing protein [Candidatus Didemnitutus sp.]